MAWQFVVDGKGQEWAVNQDLMYALVRANFRAVELKRRMKVEVESHIIGPDLTNVVINYSGLGVAVDRGAADWWQETKMRLAALPGEQVVQDLVLLRAEERAKTAEVAKAQAEASRASQNAINASVNRGEIALTVATWTRDLSASVLVAGATLLSGGTAAAVLAAGSGLKGVSKYQDTGNVGSAVIEAGTNLVVGAIGIASEATKIATDQNVLLVLGSTIDATMEGGKAIIEGQKADTAMKLAAARFGVDLIAGKLPMSKFGAWTKVRSLVTGATSIAADKGVGVAPSIKMPGAAKPAASGSQLAAAPPATRSVSWAAGNGADDRGYVSDQVLRPASTMAGFPGMSRGR